MARNDKLTPGIQVFRGSRTRPDVFAQTMDDGCCEEDYSPDRDKLAVRVRFDNGLAHLNPTGGNEKYRLPYGDGFSGTRSAVVKAINKGGVGTHISVIAIPTYAFVTGVGVHVESEEAGLTFELVTRNGLELPLGNQFKVENKVVDCDKVTRTLTASEDDNDNFFEDFGALDGNDFIDIFGRNCDSGCGFSLEADEIALKVKTMPASGTVLGTFDITVSVNYDFIHRAEA